MRTARLTVLVACALALTGIAAPPAHAEQGVALLTGNRIAVFDSANPAVITPRPITGIAAGQTVRGIDLRLSTGVIYALTVTTGAAANSAVSTYTIDPTTGAASLVGVTAAALAAAGDVPTGSDVNPRGTDRIRYVNTNDENARLNQDTGGLAGNDTDLTPAASTVLIGAAHDRNLTGATATLYAIDRIDSALAIVGGIAGTPSPNSGVVTELSPLGFSLNPTHDGGFDIAPSGTFYAALTDDADDLTRLYRFSGAAVPVPIGTLGDGTQEVLSLTFLPDPPDPPAPPPPPPPGPPAPDTARPVVLVALAKTSVRLGGLGRGFRYEFSCNEACTARASLTVPGRSKALARASAALPAAGKGRLRVKAGRRAVAQLRRAKRRRIRGTLTTVFTDPAGNRTTVRKRLFLLR